jgi:hypothetical protein
MVFLIVFAGAIGGLNLYRLLPDTHLTTETRDAVRLGIGMVSVLASLVLGLLTASAKGTFDHTDAAMRAYAADIILLDQTLRAYGPETKPVRNVLLDYTDRSVQGTWPTPPAKQAPLEDQDAGRLLAGVVEQILALVPTTPNQTWLRDQALNISAQLLHTRWALLVNQEGSISPVLIAIMVVWVTLIFVSFGLNAPRNSTVVAAFLVCSLSIGASIFLILEMDSPFDGVIMISGEPMKSALTHLQE